LLRAMVPLARPPQANLTGTPVLIISGGRDPIIPASNSTHLAEMLSGAGASVQHRRLPVGHQLSQADLSIAGEWIKSVRVVSRTEGAAPASDERRTGGVR